LAILHKSGNYNFEYVALVADEVSNAYSYLDQTYNFAYYPTCFFDGGDEVLVGGYSTQSYYTNRLNNCGNREVANIDLTIELNYINNETLEIIVNLTNNHFVNTPPEDPTEPEGDDEGLIDMEYQFATTASDFDEHQLWYMWDWESEMTGWLGPYNSGEEVIAAHTWTDIGIYDVSVKVKDEYDEESAWSSVATIHIAVPGDANGDEECNVADAIQVIYYVFKQGPAPIPLISGDANCDGDCNVADAVHIINYVFRQGAPPGCF
jgi:hypothetical protein